MYTRLSNTIDWPGRTDSAERPSHRGVTSAAGSRDSLAINGPIYLVSELCTVRAVHRILMHMCEGSVCRMGISALHLRSALPEVHESAALQRCWLALRQCACDAAKICRWLLLEEAHPGFHHVNELEDLEAERDAGGASGPRITLTEYRKSPGPRAPSSADSDQLARS